MEIKSLLKKKKKKILHIANIGAIHLYSNQKKYYLSYFMLLLSPWEYMPSEEHIQELRDFIKKYYKQEIYLDIFNKAVAENKIYINTFKHICNSQNPLLLKYKL